MPQQYPYRALVNPADRHDAIVGPDTTPSACHRRTYGLSSQSNPFESALRDIAARGVQLRRIEVSEADLDPLAWVSRSSNT